MDRRAANRGQSLVEFALTLSLLVLILLGILDLGRAYNAYVIITNAARNGAYFGSFHPTDTAGIKQRAVLEAQDSGVTLTTGNVTITTTGVNGTPIAVTVNYNFDLLTTFLPGFEVLTLHSTAKMMILR
jgi:Flp pilus assembly protein TadG